MKTCTRCGETKPLDQFHRRAGSSDGRRPTCKDCRREFEPNDLAYHAKYRDEHRDEIRRRHRERHAVRRRQVAELKLTMACVDCGWSPANLAEARYLEFDHIDPATKHTSRLRSAFLLSWSWERIEAEMAKCEMRCRPCHRRRTGEQRHNLIRRTTQLKENQ